MKQSMIAGFALIAVLFLYRLLPVFMGDSWSQNEWLPNVSPVASLCLCGMACLPRRFMIPTLLISLLGTDLILHMHYPTAFVAGYFAVKYFAFISIAIFGFQLRAMASANTAMRARVLFPSVIGASLFFYLVTNTASWLYEPAYAKDISGWTQAVTVGLPGYVETWKFFRNSLLGDLVFTALFLASIHAWKEKTATAQSPVHSARW
jgi:hypothetical protein